MGSIPLDRPTYETQIRHAAAYLTVESCGIFGIASAMCFTPSGQMPLSAILQAMQIAVGQMQMRDSAQYHTKRGYELYMGWQLTRESRFGSP